MEDDRRQSMEYLLQQSKNDGENDRVPKRRKINSVCLSKMRQNSRCEKLELDRRVAHDELDVPTIIL